MKTARTVVERRVRRGRECRRESRGNARRNLDAWVDARLPCELRARAKARWFAGWRQQLALLLQAFGRVREDGKIAAFETTRSRGDVLFLVFRQLREELDRKSTRLNSSHIQKSRMPSSA